MCLPNQICGWPIQHNPRADRLGDNKECGFEKTDLLKLDIEGAEREIFDAGDLDWMNRTHTIMIELHDRFCPGCEAAFLNAARRFGFEITQQTTGNIVAQRTRAPLVGPTITSWRKRLSICHLQGRANAAAR